MDEERRVRRERRGQHRLTPHQKACTDRNEKRADEEREPEWTELGKRLDVQAVCVANLEARVLLALPVALEGPGACAGPTMSPVVVPRRSPELGAPVPREAEKTTVEARGARAVRRGAEGVPGVPRHRDRPSLAHEDSREDDEQDDDERRSAREPDGPRHRDAPLQEVEDEHQPHLRCDEHDEQRSKTVTRRGALSE